jgi:hypothetical protein
MRRRALKRGMGEATRECAKAAVPRHHRVRLDRTAKNVLSATPCERLGVAKCPTGGGLGAGPRGSGPKGVALNCFFAKKP